MQSVVDSYFSTSHQAESFGGVVVTNHLLRQYLEERKKLRALKDNRDRLLEQKVKFKTYFFFCVCITLSFSD